MGLSFMENAQGQPTVSCKPCLSETRLNASRKVLNKARKCSAIMGRGAARMVLFSAVQYAVNRSSILYGITSVLSVRTSSLRETYIVVACGGIRPHLTHQRNQHFRGSLLCYDFDECRHLRCMIPGHRGTAFKVGVEDLR